MFEADAELRELPHLLQNHEGNAVGLTEYRQNEVLGSQVIILVPLSFLTCENDDLSTFVRESFEHPASLLVGTTNDRVEQNPWKNLPNSNQTAVRSQGWAEK
jgi:hypothetical protein